MASAASPAPSLAERLQNAANAVQEATAPYMKYIEPAVQWGFIPAVILLGMYTTKPRPAIAQFFFVG